MDIVVSLAAARAPTIAQQLVEEYAAFRHIRVNVEVDEAEDRAISYAIIDPQGEVTCFWTQTAEGEWHILNPSFKCIGRGRTIRAALVNRGGLATKMMEDDYAGSVPTQGS